jgi:hypothetical protein
LYLGKGREKTAGKTEHYSRTCVETQAGAH